MPTVTLPSPSRRAHSWDLRNLRSPGISLIVGSGVLVCRPVVGWVRSLANGGPGKSNPRLRLAIAHERELHHPPGHPAAAHVPAHLAGLAGGEPRYAPTRPPVRCEQAR